MSQFFDQLVEQSGLSPLFARNALARAVRRAGIDPREMTRRDLDAALPEIERTIQTFMPNDAPSVVARLGSLGR